jgi:hypothetical protein
VGDPVGVGGFEIWFIAFIFLLSFGLPVAIVVFAVRMMRSEQGSPVVAVLPPDEGAPTTRCAVCNNIYRADYDACPYCARQVAAEGSLDVTAWGTGRVWSLLVASLWPLLYIFVFFGFVASLALMTESGGSEPPFGVFVFFGLHILTIFLSFALMGIYLFIAIKSPIASNSKLLWAAALFFGGMMAFPLAFYFLVWEPRAKAARGAAALSADAVSQPEHG